MTDDYDSAVQASFTLSELVQVVDAMRKADDVPVWDGKLVLSHNNSSTWILGELWRNVEVDEWWFDPRRHGEKC